MARTLACKEAQKRYRQRCQEKDPVKFKAQDAKRHRERYQHTRNYKDRGNWCTSFKLLYNY